MGPGFGFVVFFRVHRRLRLGYFAAAGEEVGARIELSFFLFFYLFDEEVFVMFVTDVEL